MKNCEPPNWKVFLPTSLSRVSFCVSDTSSSASLLPFLFIFSWFQCYGPSKIFLSRVLSRSRLLTNFSRSFQYVDHSQIHMTSSEANVCLYPIFKLILDISVCTSNRCSMIHNSSNEPIGTPDPLSSGE